jgi:hypothetical protein
MSDDTKRDDGGPAFPRDAWITGRHDNNGDSLIPIQFGMSLRDYFAAQALVGILQVDELRPCSEPEMEHLAKRVYQVADAMLRARRQPR